MIAHGEKKLPENISIMQRIYLCELQQFSKENSFNGVLKMRSHFFHEGAH